MFKKGQGNSSSRPAPGAGRSPIKQFSSTITIRRDGRNTVISSNPNLSEMDRSKQSSDAASKTEDLAHPRPALKAKDSKTKKDLMISYSHADKEIMLKIRDNLEKCGISVWVDVSGLQAGVDFLSKIGEAIIDCKLFIALLSATSINSKYCQDELALAYVSNRAIFPVALEEPGELYKGMDTGMRLQLAGYEWNVLGRDPQKFDERFNQLLKSLKAELLRQEQDNAETSTPKDDDKSQSEKTDTPRPQSRHKLNKKNKTVMEEVVNEKDEVVPETYWKNNFGQVDQVLWDDFLKCFKRDFKPQMDAMFKEPDDQEWLFNILNRELEVEDNILFKYQLLAFCNIDGEYQPMWERIKDQARESWSMKDVFDMNSSVRVDAIENLGKFRSAAVIDALRDLLSDPDANARAVAAVSLARTDANDPVTTKFLMKTLNDKDRLVREAGCLALGHLQVKQAVSKLLHMWRNDVISHVREAANVALNQIGGPEVEKAMRVTKVLADEIRQLTNS